MLYYITEIVFILWACLFGFFQVPVLKAFKEHVPQDNPFRDPFHFRGALLSIFIGGLLVGFYYYSTRDWVHTIMNGVNLFAIYEILFNGVVGVLVWDDFFYIGTTARHDIFIQKYRLKELRFIICLITVIALNALNIIISK